VKDDLGQVTAQKSTSFKPVIRECEAAFARVLIPVSFSFDERKQKVLSAIE